MHIPFKHDYRGKKEFDENRHIYILIKKRQFLLIIQKFYKELGNIIKNKINSELIHSKNY